LTRNLRAAVDQPPVVALSSNVMIFKYKDWNFSEEDVNPKQVYTGIDLTGLLTSYFRAVFDASKREALPAGWLAELASEQARTLKLKKYGWKHRIVEGADIYATFDDKEKLGTIFIIEKKQVYRVQISGPKSKYKSFIASISERQHEAE
jgi:hypothetical protein